MTTYDINDNKTRIRAYTKKIKGLIYLITSPNCFSLLFYLPGTLITSHHVMLNYHLLF